MFVLQSNLVSLLACWQCKQTPHPIHLLVCCLGSCIVGLQSNFPVVSFASCELSYIMQQKQLLLLCIASSSEM